MSSFDVGDVFRGVGREMECVRDDDGDASGDRGRVASARTWTWNLRADRSASRHRVRLASEMACTKFVASSRCKLWWMTPGWGSAGADVPKETQFLLMELADGEGYACALPTSGNIFRSTLEGTAKGGVNLIVESNCADESAIRVDMVMFMATASSPYEAIHAAMARAKRGLGTFELLENKKIPQCADVFGWCSWDAFYTDVTPQGIEHGVMTLRQGGTPARFVIIDDGWQSVLPDKSYRKASVKDKMIPNPDAVVKPPPTTSAAPPSGFFAAMCASFYWNRLHASKFQSFTWHFFRLLMNYVFFGVVKLVVAGMSNFNHRVYAVKANHKFQALEDDDSMKRTLSQRVLEKTLPQFFRKRNEASKMNLPAAELVDGLEKVVTKIKTEFGVRYVYCWHALMGYWGGIHPDEENVAKYGAVLKYPRHTPGLLSIEPSQAWDPLTIGGIGVPSPETIAHFYVVMHDYLSASGVDGVKVDAQAVVGALGYKNGGGPSFARRVHAALEESVTAHFPDNGIINCMCHSTENFYNFKSSAVARASDDFYPTNEASHTVHIANVVYNSIFMGEVVLPDWDMFQSENESGALHAAARAIGGCPVYVSDHPGKHDFNVLRQLVMPSGNVLRCRSTGRPTRDCLFRDVTRDGRSALKIWNRNYVNSVVGAFNIQGASWSRVKNQFVSHEKPIPPTTAVVCPNDVEGLRDRSREGARFVSRSHRRGDIRVLNLEESVSVMLAHKDWEIFTIAELLVSNAVHFAAMGLSAMMNGGGSVLSVDFFSNVATIRAYGLGDFACYSNKSPKSVSVDETDVAFAYEHRTGALNIPLGASENIHAISIKW